MRVVAVALVGAVLGAAGHASAHVALQAGAGFNFPAGAANGALDMGGAFTLGVGYDPNKRFGLSLDYMYAGNRVSASAFNSTDLVGLHALHVLGLTARANFLPDSFVGAHLLVAPGLYYRHVSIDQVVGTTVGTYCDPFLLYCAPTAAPLTTTVGTRDQFAPGLGVGGGLDLKTGPVRPYLEVRVEWIFGPSVRTSTGAERSTNATFIPLLLGIRY